MTALAFPAPLDTPQLHELRLQVRDFLAGYLKDEPRARRPFTYLGRHDPAFSAALGRRGWIGMSLPREYGGQDAGVLERYVVFEETAGRARARRRALGGRAPERAADRALRHDRQQKRWSCRASRRASATSASA